MKLQVRLFAGARQLAGCDILEVECRDGATLADLRSVLQSDCPPLVPLLPHMRFAVNAQYAVDDQVLTASDQIAGIPPVSGG